MSQKACTQCVKNGRLCTFRGWEKHKIPLSKKQKGGVYTPSCLWCYIKKRKCEGGMWAKPIAGKEGSDYLPDLKIRQDYLENLISRGMITRARRDSWCYPDGACAHSHSRVFA